MGAPTIPSERASFLGEARTFALDLAAARLLEKRLNIGCMYLQEIFKEKQAHITHVEEVLRFGLIGAGVDENEAAELIEAGVKAGWILKYYVLCHNILCNFLGEMDDEEPGKPGPLATEANP